MAIKASIAPLADEAEFQTMDVITPDPVAAPRQTADMIDSQGYIYFVQHGSRGNADFGTKIYIDRNGSAADIAPDIAVADLLGVGKSELTFGYYNPHIIM